MYSTDGSGNPKIRCVRGGSGYAVNDTFTLADPATGTDPPTATLTVSKVTAGGEARWGTTGNPADGGSGSVKYIYGTTPLIAGRWYQLVGQSGGSQTQLYVNSILEADMTERNLRGGTSTIRIGCGVSSGTTEANFSMVSWQTAVLSLIRLRQQIG